MNIRRLPGFMYHYKIVAILMITSLFLIVYLLIYWGIMCTNLQAWRHVSNVVSRTIKYFYDSLLMLKNITFRHTLKCKM